MGWRPFNGASCCEKAQRVDELPPEERARFGYCVCWYRTTCPDHGTIHFGTHD